MENILKWLIYKFVSIQLLNKNIRFFLLQNGRFSLFWNTIHVCFNCFVAEINQHSFSHIFFIHIKSSFLFYFFHLSKLLISNQFGMYFVEADSFSCIYECSLLNEHWMEAFTEMDHYEKHNQNTNKWRKKQQQYGSLQQV